MSHIEDMAKIICETNDPGRWKSMGRAEKDRRRKEAQAIIDYLYH